MYLIVYTLQHDGGHSLNTDHWDAHERPDDADKAYAALLKRNDVYIASKCAVLESTDYAPTEQGFNG